jgi:hypothetical protein
VPKPAALESTDEMSPHRLVRIGRHRNAVHDTAYSRGEWQDVATHERVQIPSFRPFLHAINREKWSALFDPSLSLVENERTRITGDNLADGEAYQESTQMAVPD